MQSKKIKIKRVYQCQRCQSIGGFIPPQNFHSDALPFPAPIFHLGFFLILEKSGVETKKER